MQSPREAAEQARVYRRRNRRRPRERWLRIVGLAGTLLVHLLVLLGVVLGPAYVPPDLPDRPVEALQVRFIEKKQEPPPPPPPVRGTPPKLRGPVHRAGANTGMAHQVMRRATPLPSTAALAPIPVPTLQPPVIDAKVRPAVPVPAKVVAATVPPVTLPTPAPTPDLAPVPLSGEPPTFALDTPPVSKPVPPTFQPEVPRKVQAEGNRPIPPPPSLAMPELPAQAPPKMAPPTLAMDARLPASDAPASVSAVRAEAAAAPPVPDLAPVPLPAQAAPAVELQAQLSPPVPIVAESRPQVQAPAVRVAEVPQLESVPVAPIAPSLLEKPTQPVLDVPDASVPAPRVQITVAAAEPSPAAAPSEPDNHAPTAASKDATSTSASTPDSATAPASAKAEAVAAAPQADQANDQDRSSAPDASPQGRDTATPGRPDGSDKAPLAIGKDGSINLPAPGPDHAGDGHGHDQGNDNGTSEGGNDGQARLGSYIQLKPHGDTDIMSHRVKGIGYKATRFEQDWTPEGESALDTALRHAVEKTTVQHVFHLPRGVRIKCVAMPLFPMAMFGCGGADPPPAPVEQAVYAPMHLGETPLVPPVPSTTASAPAAPIRLDNSVQCANARVSGGPMPPGCTTTPTSPPPRPASSSSAWVPASDQF